jgi:hypothetical protein
MAYLPGRQLYALCAVEWSPQLPQPTAPTPTTRLEFSSAHRNRDRASLNLTKSALDLFALSRVLQRIYRDYRTLQTQVLDAGVDLVYRRI